ncbi:MAG: hypothetical protein HQL65_14615 [Magnetococcales bacterium]|nr:hypothetical protein [Magnetococcales bacterium]
MVRRTKEVELEGQKITIRELTVAEVRHWFKDLEQVQEGSIDLVNEGIVADASLGDVVRMTDLQVADLDEMTPSTIETLIVACREINPNFFRLRDRLLKAARAMP